MICNDPFQAKLFRKKVYKFFVLKIKRLLKAIQSFQKFVYHIIICFGFCAFEDFYINKLVDKTIQKSNFDIYLVYI